MPSAFYSITKALRAVLMLCLVLTGAIGVALTLHNIFDDPGKLIWSSIRLAPVFGLRHGYPLYAGPEAAAPMTGFIYPPLAALAYWPTLFFSSPTSAVGAGSLLSCFYYFAPVGAYYWLADRARAPLAFLFFLLSSLLFVALRHAGFCVHADAPALGVSVLAVAFLLRGRENTAGCLSVLAVFCKQTFLFVPFCLLAWSAVNAGRAAAWKVFTGASLALVGLGIICGSLFGWRACFYCTFTLPALHVWQFGLGEVALELLRAVAPLLGGLVLLQALRGREKGPAGASAFLWLLLATAAFPFAVLGRVKVGGFVNNYAPPLYFLLIAIGSTALGTDKKKVAEVFLAATILSALLWIRSGEYRAIPTLWEWAPSPENLATAYVRKHPGEAYFPLMPLAHLMGEGRLYHLGTGIYEHYRAGERIDDARLRVHLPAKMQVICQSLSSRSFHSPRVGFLAQFDHSVSLRPEWQCQTRGDSLKLPPINPVGEGVKQIEAPEPSPRMSFDLRKDGSL